VAENAVSTKQVVTFTALPGGYRDSGGAFGSIGDTGGWWGSTQDSTDTAWTRGLDYSTSVVDRGNGSKDRGFSVRCVRD